MGIRYVKEFEFPADFGFTKSNVQRFAKGGHVKPDRREFAEDSKEESVIRADQTAAVQKRACGGSVKHKYKKGGMVHDENRVKPDRHAVRVEGKAVVKKARGGKVTPVPFESGGRSTEFKFRKGGKVWVARPHGDPDHDGANDAENHKSGSEVEAETKRGVERSSEPFEPPVYPGREEFASGGRMPKGGPGLGHKHAPRGAGGRHMGALGMAAGPLMSGLGASPGGAAGAPQPLGGGMGAPPGGPPAGPPMGGRPPMPMAPPGAMPQRPMMPPQRPMMGAPMAPGMRPMGM